MKINESELLRLRFNKITLNKIEKHLEILRKNKLGYKVIDFVSKNLFVLKYEEYDSNLLGVIDTELLVYHVKSNNGKYRWLCLVDRKEIIEIKKVDDITNLSSTIQYDNTHGFVYIIKSQIGYKIGSSRQIHNRTRIFEVKLSIDWEFLKIFKLKNYSKIERKLHKMFKHLRTNGEWFNLSNEDLKNIESYIEILNSPS